MLFLHLCITFMISLGCMIHIVFSLYTGWLDCYLHDSLAIVWWHWTWLFVVAAAMESRLESPKQLTSNSKIRDLVQSSRDSRPPSKSSKHASASVSKVPSSSRLPQQIQARQSLKLQQERPKPNPRLQSPAPQLKPPVSSKLPVRNGKAGPSHEALVLDRFKKPESSRAPSKLPPSKVTSGSGQQKPVERKIVEGRQGANRNSTGAINGSERNRLSNQHKVSASGQAPVVQRKDTYARPSNKPRPASAAELRQQSEHRRQVCVFWSSYFACSLVLCILVSYQW